MACPTITYRLAHAAAWDAGNRHATKHGRKVWNEEDYNAAAEEFERLYLSRGIAGGPIGRGERETMTNARIWMERTDRSESLVGRLERASRIMMRFRPDGRDTSITLKSSTDGTWTDDAGNRWRTVNAATDVR